MTYYEPKQLVLNLIEEEVSSNPFKACKIIDYNFKVYPDLEKDLKYGNGCNQITYNNIIKFIETFKFVRTKTPGKATEIPIATSGETLKRITGNYNSSALLLKKLQKLGLIEMTEDFYRFNSKDNKCRIYAYNFKAEERILKYFKENNITLKEKERQINPDLDILKYLQNKDIRISSHLRIPVKGTKQKFEDTVLYLLYKRYPIIRYCQEKVKRINEIHYHHSELKLRFEPTLKFSSNGKYLRKIGIRLTSPVCNSKKTDTETRETNDYFGLLRDDVRKKFNVEAYTNADVKSSIPRVTRALNTGVWVDEEIDFYQELLAKTIDQVTQYEPKTDLEMEIYKYFNFTDNRDSREDVKFIHQRIYFANSPREAYSKILWCSGKKARLLDSEHKECLKEMLKVDFECLRKIEGRTYDSEIFLWESIIYLLALEKILESGVFCILYYDSFETSEPIDRRKIVEEAFYEFKRLNNLFSNKDEISSVNFVPSDISSDFDSKGHSDLSSQNQNLFSIESNYNFEDLEPKFYVSKLTEIEYTKDSVGANNVSNVLDCKDSIEPNNANYANYANNAKECKDSIDTITSYNILKQSAPSPILSNILPIFHRSERGVVEHKKLSKVPVKFQKSHIERSEYG